MLNYNEFIIEKSLNEEIDKLFESVNDLNEGIVGRVKIKKALKRWRDSKMALNKLDYEIKKKTANPSTNDEADKKIKAAGDKKKEALSDIVQTAEDEMEKYATSDRLKTKVDLGKIKVRKEIDKDKLQHAEELGNNAEIDTAKENLKELVKKEKELATKNKELDAQQKLTDDVNAAQVEVEKLEKQLENEKDDNKKKELKIEIIDKKIVKKELESKKALVNNQDASSFKEEITKLKDEKNRLEANLDKAEDAANKNNNVQQHGGQETDETAESYKFKQ